MKTSPVDYNTIYFVYIGEELPEYAKASLKIARSTSKSRIHLIGNRVMRKSAEKSGVGFTAIEDFYDGTRFKEAGQNVLSDASFRSGFWLKSMERLFILEQFAFEKGLDAFWHAEIDQLLLNTSELTSSLTSTKKRGIFVPFHSEDAVVASIMFVNDCDALTSLTSFARSGETFNNEMQLLSKWAMKNPNRAFALPTFATEIYGKEFIVPSGVQLLTKEETTGLVDAAQLGQWIAGIDPRNVPLRELPTTKFIDVPSRGLLTSADFEKIEFTLDKSASTLWAKFNHERYRIYNLHMHSKCHVQILKSRPSVEKLLNISNSKIVYRIPGMRKSQIASFLAKVLSIIKRDPTRVIREIKWRTKYKLGFRPTSYPFISGDTFRSISDHKWESNSKSLRPSDIKTGDIIFCESELLEELNSLVLAKTTEEIVLILGNSDRNHTLDVMAEISPPLRAIIFAQNILEDFPHSTPLPIGLENAWRSNHGIVKPAKVRLSSTLNRFPRIMSGFNLSTNPVERTKAKNALSSSDVVDEIRNVTPSEHQNLLTQYSFVASPPGNGIDTHRTWEALYFKCVPIVLRSHMTTYFESIGIPIWVVDSFSEITTQSEESLSKKYQDLSALFENEAIWADYWIKQIESAALSLGK